MQAYHIFQLICNFASLYAELILKNITLADEFPKINIGLFVVVVVVFFVFFYIYPLIL